MTGALGRAVGAAALAVACGALLGGCGAAQPGLTEQVSDERLSIALSREDASHLRRGMRIYLESVEGITEAASRHDEAKVIASAKRSGMGMLEDLSVADALKLPPEFVVMSIDTHQKFEALARAADAGAGSKQIMDELGAILANCTSCHATYRLSR